MAEHIDRVVVSRRVDTILFGAPVYKYLHLRTLHSKGSSLPQKTIAKETNKQRNKEAKKGGTERRETRREKETTNH